MRRRPRMRVGVRREDRERNLVCRLRLVQIDSALSPYAPLVREAEGALPLRPFQGWLLPIENRERRLAPGNRLVDGLRAIARRAERPVGVGQVGLQQGPALGCRVARDRFQGALVSGDRRLEVLGLAAAALGVALPDPPPKAGSRFIPCNREWPRAELSLKLQCPLCPHDAIGRIARLRQLLPEADELGGPLLPVAFLLLRQGRQRR